MAIELLKPIERLNIVQAINTRLAQIKAGTEYTAGAGVEIDEANAISLKLDETKENAATINENGLFVEKTESVSPGKEYEAGDGLSLENDTFSVKIDEKSIGLESSAAGLKMPYGIIEGASNGANRFKIKTQLDFNSFQLNFFVISTSNWNLKNTGTTVTCDLPDGRFYNRTMYGADLSEFVGHILCFCYGFGYFVLYSWPQTIGDEPIPDGPSI